MFIDIRNDVSVLGNLLISKIVMRSSEETIKVGQNFMLPCLLKNFKIAQPTFVLMEASCRRLENFFCLRLQKMF